MDVALEGKSGHRSGLRRSPLLWGTSSMQRRGLGAIEEQPAARSCGEKMVVTAGGAPERRRNTLERYRRCRTSPGSRRKGRRWSETRNKDGQK
jgi:hypothetical protein